MDDEPEHPADESDGVDRPDRRDAPEPADGRHRPQVAVAERPRLGVAVQPPAIVRAACLPDCMATSATPGSRSRPSGRRRRTPPGWPGSVQSGSDLDPPGPVDPGAARRGELPRERRRLDPADQIRVARIDPPDADRRSPTSTPPRPRRRLASMCSSTPSGVRPLRRPGGQLGTRRAVSARRRAAPPAAPAGSIGGVARSGCGELDDLAGQLDAGRRRRRPRPTSATGRRAVGIGLGLGRLERPEDLAAQLVRVSIDFMPGANSANSVVPEVRLLGAAGDDQAVVRHVAPGRRWPHAARSCLRRPRR